MFNVSMDLDMANGTRGHTVDILMKEGESRQEELDICDCSIRARWAGTSFLSVAPLTRRYRSQDNSCPSHLHMLSPISCPGSNEHFREEVVQPQRLDHATKIKMDAF